LASIGQMDLFDQARPFLEELTKATGETSHLAVLDDGMALYVDKVESQRMLSRPSHVGRRLPAYCTGVGKAMLAFAPDEQVEAVIARGLERMTPNTITDPARLRNALADVRRVGYAIDDEEIEEGLVCVAAPIRDRAGSVVAGASIGGPASRIHHAGEDRIAERVTATARAISAMLGWSTADPAGDDLIEG
jgi:DNA-binding IclR family transcriptional regulator